MGCQPAPPNFALIDLDHLAHALPVHLVLGDLGTRARQEREEPHLAVPVGPVVQERFERLEPAHDVLRQLESIDAHEQLRVLLPLDEVLADLRDLLASGGRAQRFRIQRHRVGADEHRSVADRIRRRRTSTCASRSVSRAHSRKFSAQRSAWKPSTSAPSIPRSSSSRIDEGSTPRYDWAREGRVREVRDPRVGLQLSQERRGRATGGSPARGRPGRGRRAGRATARTIRLTSR